MEGNSKIKWQNKDYKSSIKKRWGNNKKRDEEELRWKVMPRKNYQIVKRWKTGTSTFMKIKLKKTRKRNLLNGCKVEPYWTRKQKIKGTSRSLQKNLWTGIKRTSLRSTDKKWRRSFLISGLTTKDNFRGEEMKIFTLLNQNWDRKWYLKNWRKCRIWRSMKRKWDWCQIIRCKWWKRENKATCIKRMIWRTDKCWMIERW